MHRVVEIYMCVYTSIHVYMYALNQNFKGGGCGAGRSCTFRSSPGDSDVQPGSGATDSARAIPSVAPGAHEK